MAYGDSNNPSGGDTAGKPPTWEDIMHLHDSLGAEILGGKIRYKTMARFSHAETIDDMRRQLPSNRDGTPPDGWWIATDVDARLSDSAYVKPDLSGWRKSSLAARPVEWPVRQLPDWVCEVMSRSTQAYDRGEKAAAYAAASVPWYWIVDPDERTVEVLELVNGRWTICGVYTDGAVLTLPPFDQTVVTVSDLFLPLPAPTP